MYRCDVLLCAERVIRDAERNFFSIINVFDAMRPAGFPLMIPNMDVLAFVELEAGAIRRGEAVFEMTQGGKPLFRGGVPFDMEPEKRTNRITLHVSGLVLAGPGDLELSLSVGGQVLRTLRIPVEAGSPHISRTHSDAGERSPMASASGCV